MKEQDRNRKWAERQLKREMVYGMKSNGFQKVESNGLGAVIGDPAAAILVGLVLVAVAMHL